MTQRPGAFGPAMGKSSAFNVGTRGQRISKQWKQGSRPCAVFDYVGDAAPQETAAHVMRYWNKVPA